MSDRLWHLWEFDDLDGTERWKPAGTSSQPTRRTWPRWRRPTAAAASHGLSAGSTLLKNTKSASYWLGPLLNNLGWRYYAAGDYEAALAAFERALEARERESEHRAAIEIARYAVGKTLRSLDRPVDAIPLLEQAVAWASAEGAPDGWFHEELALEYAAVGKDEDARMQALLAVPLLETADPSFAEDTERAPLLRALAGTR